MEERNFYIIIDLYPKLIWVMCSNLCFLDNSAIKKASKISNAFLIYVLKLLFKFY